MWGSGGSRILPPPAPPAPGAPVCPRTWPEAARYLFAPSREGGLPLVRPSGAPPPDAPGPQARAAKSPLGCPQAGPASRPGRAELTTRLAPPASCRAAPSQRPAPPARAAAQQGPHREALQVSGRHGELRTRRAGRGEHPGRDGDQPAAGRAPPGRLRLNGSNMATSWKLPLAAAAGEVAEPPPPPPAGPASPPGPATSAARAPLGRPGVSAARREVQAAGAAGTCSPQLGGREGSSRGAKGRCASLWEAGAESGWL